jgi:hypothetical protein
MQIIGDEFIFEGTSIAEVGSTLGSGSSAMLQLSCLESHSGHGQRKHALGKYFRNSSEGGPEFFTVVVSFRSTDYRELFVHALRAVQPVVTGQNVGIPVSGAPCSVLQNFASSCVISSTSETDKLDEVQTAPTVHVSNRGPGYALEKMTVFVGTIRLVQDSDYTVNGLNLMAWVTTNTHSVCVFGLRTNPSVDPSKDAALIQTLRESLGPGYDMLAASTVPFLRLFVFTKKDLRCVVACDAFCTWCNTVCDGAQAQHQLCSNSCANLAQNSPSNRSMCSIIFLFEYSYRVRVLASPTTLFKAY